MVSGRLLLTSLNHQPRQMKIGANITDISKYDGYRILDSEVSNTESIPRRTDSPIHKHLYHNLIHLSTIHDVVAYLVIYLEDKADLLKRNLFSEEGFAAKAEQHTGTLLRDVTIYTNN